jgi:hypothetical protein
MVSMRAFMDEILTIELCKEASGVGAERAAALVKKMKWPAILGGGYVAGKQVEQAAKDYALGRQVRKQYEGQGQQ